MHDLLEDLILLLQLLNEALLLLALLGQRRLAVLQLLNQVLLALPEPPLSRSAVQPQMSVMSRNAALQRAHGR